MLKKERLWVKKRLEYIHEVMDLSKSQIQDIFKKYKEAGLKDSDIPYLLAVIKEVFRREKGILLYDEQILCAAALYNKQITELYTGEGKTYAATAAAIMLSTRGPVHIVTVNDYLAERDAMNTKPIYEYFGLTVGSNSRLADKNNLYKKDIIYSSSAELVFDYLRYAIRGKRKAFSFTNAIIDEIDFVLLDNANSDFSISVNPNTEAIDPTLYYKANDIVSKLHGIELYDDFGNEPEDKSVSYVYNSVYRLVYFTESGYNTVCQYLGITDLANEDIHLYRIIISTLEAKHFYKAGLHYNVINNEVKLICESNGRILENSRLENELHAAIEAKENVPLTNGHGLNYSISYQVFFSKYEHLVGLSGTCFVAKDEFRRIFNIETTRIPPHKKVKRIDYPDYLVKTKREKIETIASFIKFYRTTSVQPILIISEDEQEAQMVYDTLLDTELNPSILLNEHTQYEQYIIDAAGKKNAITVSTNMLSRGTDIILNEIFKQTSGLFVVCATHFTSKRIDIQVKGRSGRQGEAGRTIYISSLEDNIYKWFSKHAQKTLEAYAKEIRSHYHFAWFFDHMGTRQKISSLIESEQNRIQNIFSEQRFINFLYDMSIEKYLELLYQEQDDNLHIAIESAREYARILNDEISEKLNIEDSLITLNEKISQYEDTLSKKLLCSLFNEISYKLFMIYKDNMRKLKSYMHHYRKGPYEEIYEYQHICGTQFQRLRKDIWREVICYFLSSNIQT